MIMTRFKSGPKHFFRPLISNNKATTTLIFWVFFLSLGLLLLLLLFACFLDFSVSGFISTSQSQTRSPSEEYPLRCPSSPGSSSAPRRNNNNNNNPAAEAASSNVTCPSYFRWIHEDLRHWKDTGITRDMLERGRKKADFRLVILDGRVYVEKYRPAIQTRDTYTQWGILQLLRLYPGRLPDLELLFDCDDRPKVLAKDFPHPDSGPPPLFRYCSDRDSLDVVFPDWSFWGWAETNIKPWKNVLEDIKEGNKRVKWKDRVPYAYWRGNPTVVETRGDLMKCNVTDQYDWNARLYVQDWKAEPKSKQSKLEEQCTHKFKIYIEGWGWSVSEKYILACDSMVLYVRSLYYDFYSRGMSPLQHYWPIRREYSMQCSSLKYAVEWGNNHTREAEGIGKAGSKYVFEEMKMELVYDYMLHLLTEYASLLRFKPTVPPGAVEVFPETMACHQNETYKNFMMQSLVTSPSDSMPCNLPPAFDRTELRDYWDGYLKSTKKVEALEDEYYWRNYHQKPN